MRIAFVGKGGSGKTTLSVLFAKYLEQNNHQVILFDADINMHIKDSIGFEKPISQKKFLSHPQSIEKIKKYLIHKRKDIKNLDSFRKTTPPSKQSHLLSFGKETEMFLKNFLLKKGKIQLGILGTYEEKDIGKSCYHNNLSILENILSHFDDKNNFIIVDMVAGVDSFANTLHSQFDILCIIVEPTIRSIDVYRHYKKLAKKSDVFQNVFIVGNKISSKRDIDFIEKNIDRQKIIGYINKSKIIDRYEQERTKIDIKKLEKNNINTLKKIELISKQNQENPNIRLKRLWKLHEKYVSQKNIKDRFGDLTDQIDKNFLF